MAWKITYTSTSRFQHQFKHRTVATWPGASHFTVIMEGYTAEFNRFYDATSDICSVSDATAESNLHAFEMNNLIEEHFKYLEKSATPGGHQSENAPIVPPSLFDANHLHVREKLTRERREEKPHAANYNLRTGQVHWWY